VDKIAVTYRYTNLTFFLRFLYSIKSHFSITPEQMAKAYVVLGTDQKYLDVTGKYFDENLNFQKSSQFSMNKENIHKLMQVTYKFI